MNQCFLFLVGTPSQLLCEVCCHEQLTSMLTFEISFLMATPTSIVSSFPKPYRTAFFILTWSTHLHDV